MAERTDGEFLGDTKKPLEALPQGANLYIAVEYNVTNGARYLMERHKEGG